eukprot:355670-Chlamydomonas_euryale.AAC.5
MCGWFGLCRNVQLTTALVLGSSDRKFTVWVRGEKVPLVSGTHFFSASITDVAWMPDGSGFFVCSYDGTIACMRFDPGELGACSLAAEALVARRQREAGVRAGDERDGMERHKGNRARGARSPA